MSNEAARLCEEISTLLEYRPDVGGSCLVWKVDRGVRKLKGTRAGCVDGRYWRLRIEGKNYLAHRLVWLLVHKHLPTCHLDHIDGDRGNNQIENLRLTPKNQMDNMQNSAKQSNNTSGYTGVDWHKASNRWRARIKAQGVSYDLGRFDTPEEAYASYLAAKTELHTFQSIPRRAT